MTCKIKHSVLFLFVGYATIDLFQPRHCFMLHGVCVIASRNLHPWQNGVHMAEEWLLLKMQLQMIDKTSPQFEASNLAPLCIDLPNLHLKQSGTIVLIYICAPHIRPKFGVQANCSDPYINNFIT